MKRLWELDKINYLKNEKDFYSFILNGAFYRFKSTDRISRKL